MSSPARSSDSPADRRRVLYLLTSDISARFLRGQLGYLIDHGFEVEVGTRLCEPPADFDDGVRTHDVPFTREPSPVADVKALWVTVRLIRRLRPDTVNASTPKAGMLGMVGAWLCRVPHRVYVVRGLRFETMTGRRRRLFMMIERLTSACATTVIFNSPSLQAVAEQEGTVRPDRGVVLAGGSGNGIDVNRFRFLPSREQARLALGIKPDAEVVGFVGRLTRDKGIVDLVDALRLIGGNTVLLLVGDFESGDPVPDATRRTIENDSRIVHVPWVDETSAVYPAMDVLAFPSYREGLPNVPLEAQLCGVPVVAYSATGTVDTFSEGVGGRLIEVGDVSALADGLSALLRDEAMRQLLVLGGRRRVEERFAQTVVWAALLETLQAEGRRVHPAKQLEP